MFGRRRHDEILAILARIEAKVDALGAREGKLMAAIDDLESAVTDEVGAAASTLKLLDGILAELQAARSVDPRIVALTAKLAASKDALAAAVAANPMPAPVSPPAA